ncbi:ketosteroid isomerase family protein [Nonomuraea sp. NPDC050680]|uniref:ketosteroid isomerase family protein n=1 Tax=Nonomuraea sp. NPDC050680 TaxID=3154630 RepID=UPI0033D92F5A
MGEDYASVAEQFVESYHAAAKAAFCSRSDRSQASSIVGPLYRENSVLVKLRGDSGDEIDGIPPAVGPAAIVKMLGDNVYPYDEMEQELCVNHAVPQADGTIIVMVTGQTTCYLFIAPAIFAELFVLKQDSGSYYIAHQVCSDVPYDESVFDAIRKNRG